jgi:hypothetical protein
MAASSARQSQPVNDVRDRESDPCTATPDPTAPAGSKTSLGAKSDCNGRPDTDDSVVEAMDEQGPLVTPSDQNSNR